jgi:hypothetical protein
VHRRHDTGQTSRMSHCHSVRLLLCDRLRALARRFGLGPGSAVRGKKKTKKHRQPQSHEKPPASRRNRFPTIIEHRDRREGVAVELSEQHWQYQEAAPGLGAESRTSTLDSVSAQLTAEAAADALVAHHRSAGHIIVEHAPLSTGVEVQPASGGGQQVTAAPAPWPLRPAADRQQQQQQQGEDTTAGPVLALNPVYEESMEGSALATISASSTPAGGSVAGSVAATPGLLAVASPPQASDAQLLTEVPLSTSSAAPQPAAAPGVASGWVAKRRPGPSRFARALGCLDWKRSGGAAAGQPSGAGRVEAVAVPASIAGTSANPSPSVDSRAGSRVLLSDRVRRSDLVGSPQQAAGQPPVRGRSTAGDEGEIVALEAVSQSSSAGRMSGSAAHAAALASSETDARAAAASSPRKSPPLWSRLRKQSAAADAAAAGSSEEQQASREQQLLRAAFDAWRVHAADAAWKRHGRTDSERKDQPQSGSPRSEASVEDDIQGVPCCCCCQLRLDC